MRLKWKLVLVYLETDEDSNTNDASTPTPVPLTGPLTRARAHKLNHQVSSFLSSCPSCLDLGDMCTFVLIRNQGEDRKGKGLALAGLGLQHSTNLWWPPWLHTDSDWYVLALDGKLIKSTFQWIQPHIHITSEAPAVIVLLSCPSLSAVLCHLNFGLLALVSSWIH
jgi:hypothetical protein